MLLGQRVRIYYNIRKGCLSVQDKKTRLVIDHVDAASLTNVRFIVSASGVRKIREQKRKRVIAFVEGDWVGHGEKSSEDWPLAYFNPYKVDEFMMGAVPIHKASQVQINNKQIHVKTNA